jgi:hypothetical protein
MGSCLIGLLTLNWTSSPSAIIFASKAKWGEGWKKRYHKTHAHRYEEKVSDLLKEVIDVGQDTVQPIIVKYSDALLVSSGISSFQSG